MTIKQEVENRNRLNAKANQVEKDLIEMFTPFLNKKVRTVSGYGDWAAPIKKILNPYIASIEPDTYHVGRFHLLCHQSINSLICKIDTTFQYEEYRQKLMRKEDATYKTTAYVDEHIYFGRVDDQGILVKLEGLGQPRRTDYSEKELIETREQIKKLKDETFNLERKISVFNRR